MSRMTPEMGDPTMVSRTALVIAMPGIRSIMSPIMILSICRPGISVAQSVILMPTASAASRLKTRRLGQSAEKRRCSHQIARPNAAADRPSQMPPPKKTVQLPAARALPA